MPFASFVSCNIYKIEKIWFITQSNLPLTFVLSHWVVFHGNTCPVRYVWLGKQLVLLNQFFGLRAVCLRMCWGQNSLRDNSRFIIIIIFFPFFNSTPYNSIKYIYYNVMSITTYTPLFMSFTNIMMRQLKRYKSYKGHDIIILKHQIEYNKKGTYESNPTTIG